MSTEIIANPRVDKTKQLIQSKVEAFAEVLGDTKIANKFALMAMNTIVSDAKLLACTPQSQMSTLMDVAALMLFPSKALGHVYLVPYKDQLTFQLGYKGMIVLAYRSGQVKNMDAQVVYEADDFDFSEGTNPFVRFKKSLKPGREKSPKIAVFSAADLAGGGSSVRVMPYADVLAIRDKSKAWQSGKPDAMAFWKYNENEMAAKTAVRRHSKYLYIGDDFSSRILEDDARVQEFENKVTIEDAEVEEI